MALKFTVDSLDAVEEAHRTLYSEQNGKFVLGVEGAVSSDKLAEFRNNNTTLLKERDALTEKYKDVDLDAYRQMQTDQQKIRDKQLIDAGQVEQLFSERTDVMRKDHAKQLTAVTKERDTLKVELEGLVIDGALRDAATKHGIAPSAVEDVLLRGRKTFRLVDGKATALQGDQQLFGGNGDPLGVPEWVQSLQDSAPHLFVAATGSGSRGNGGSAGAGRQRTIVAGDNRAFIDNLADIAANKISIV